MTSGVLWRQHEPLGRHTARRVGGPCDAWVVVHDPAQLPDAIARIRSEGLARMVLGGATRVVVRDGGVAGAVLHLGLGFADIRDDGDADWVGAAVPLSILASHRGDDWAQAALSPGSVGASCRNDLGWEPWVSRVRCYVRGGIREVDLDTARRVLSAIILAVRIKHHPTGTRADAPYTPHPWAAWRSTKGESVRQTLIAAGLAGTRLRSWVLPADQPDAIVNLGGSSAADLALLSRSVCARVKQEQGVELVEAFQWLGRA